MRFVVSLCLLSFYQVQGNALYYAVKYRHEEPIVKLLLEHGADVHDAGEYGETCLHAVCRYNFTNTCKMLIQYGADVYATDDQGRYPIHSCANSVYNNERTLKFLLDEAGKRSDVTLKDFNERTPLHEAAYIRNASNVEVLIAYGADVNAQSRSGLTPLHLTSRGSPVWEILVRHGADTTIKNKQGQLPGEIM